MVSYERKKEREREQTETETETETETDRQRQTETDRQTERQRELERETERGRERQRELLIEDCALFPFSSFYSLSSIFLIFNCLFSVNNLKYCFYFYPKMLYKVLKIISPKMMQHM